MTGSRVLEIGGRSIEVSRPGKIMFPAVGVTKLDLAEYYAGIAPTMLRHLRKRPLAEQRFPDGIEGEGFFQKDVPDHFPAWIERVEVQKQGGVLTQVIIADESATLVYLADQASITLHAWLATTDALDRPDRIIIDLDPSDGDPRLVRAAARDTRLVFEQVGLVPFLMTTGSRGFHVVSPIHPDASFDEARELARDVADLLARRHPHDYTTEMRKKQRRGRVFLDHLRNSYAQTSVVPYAVRALPDAPVATPIDWDELPGMLPGAYTLRSIPRRLGQKADPWRAIDDHRAHPDTVRRALDGLLRNEGGART